jgi:3-methyladenine DNA glycosylase AlkD
MTAPLTAEDAIAQLRAAGDAQRSIDSAAYHKAARTYLGVTVPVITDLAKSWREDLPPEARPAFAAALWDSDIHEARVAAAKLLTQARIADDDAVWSLIASWVPTFDAWAIADHVCSAGARRLTADPTRLDEVETWISNENMWTRRAALVMTLPWTKLPFPKPDDLAIRDRILGWCVTLAPDRNWFIQKAIAWWLRELSKHDAPRARAFLDAHGETLKSFARKEAAQYL